MMNDTMSPRAAEDDPPAETNVFRPAENSGETEVSLTSRPATIEEIKAACAECQAYGGGDGFFGRQWDDRLMGLLLPSYKLLKLVADDSDRLGIAISQSGVKTTRATCKNQALICINIAAQPSDTAQRKLCSGWAQILNEARTANVPIEGFVAWVKGRNEHRQTSSLANKPAKSKGLQDPNQLQLRLTGADGPIDEVLPLPPAAHATLLDALTAPGSQSERVQRLGHSLLMLADELALTAAVVPTSPSEVDAEINNAVTETADV